MKIEDLKIRYSKDALEVWAPNGAKIESRLCKGDDALYIPLAKNVGLKVIPPDRISRDSYSYYSPEDMLKNIRRIFELDLKIFPKIYDAQLICREGQDSFAVAILMEHVVGDIPKDDYDSYDWLTDDDKKYLRANLKLPISLLEEYSRISFDNNLMPDTSWFKAGANFIGDKIVDFHRWRFMPERYRMPSGDNSKEALDELYQTFLKRYKDMNLDPPKWFRAGIYEGYRFDNGAEFKGYSSDGKEYDSYRKLNFTYMSLAKNSTVLDLGCNQGFFCFQSAIHGAKKVVGLELTPQDYQTAVDINSKIFKFDNVKFINGDAIKFVEDCEKNKEGFDIVMMNSFLHQPFSNFKGSGDFLNKLKNITNRFLVFETPVHHGRMQMSLDKIHKNLSKHFRTVKISFVYNAYSKGFRAVFLCLV